MTKKDIKKECRFEKLFNSTNTIKGIKIAHVGWDNKSWKVIDSNKTFEDIIEQEKTGEYILGDIPEEKRVYSPIKEFYYQSELIDYLSSVINN